MISEFFFGCVVDGGWTGSTWCSRFCGGGDDGWMGVYIRFFGISEDG